MAQINEPNYSLYDFPTPPWATRALIEHVIHDKVALAQMSCLELACNRGFMSRTLEETFGKVISQDVFPYGYGKIGDFTKLPIEAHSVDWVITNTPFRLAVDFIQRGLDVACHGVAMLTRTTFI